MKSNLYRHSDAYSHQSLMCCWISPVKILFWTVLNEQTLFCACFLCVWCFFFSTKGYYSMSPYDDGYVSFIFTSFPLIFPPLPTSSHACSMLYPLPSRHQIYLPPSTCCYYLILSFFLFPLNHPISKASVSLCLNKYLICYPSIEARLHGLLEYTSLFHPIVFVDCYHWSTAQLPFIQSFLLKLAAFPLRLGWGKQTEQHKINEKKW